MWRRIVASELQSLTSCSSACRSASRLSSPALSRSRAAPSSFLARYFSSGAENVVFKSNKRVEDGRDILEINHPVGPFGTKEEPAVVKSVYDRRIVGCPGGEGEDEHDVVWFWLEKNKTHECPVCSQYFVLEVVGQGGDPYGHGSEDEKPIVVEPRWLDEEDNCERTMRGGVRAEELSQVRDVGKVSNFRLQVKVREEQKVSSPSHRRRVEPKPPSLGSSKVVTGMCEKVKIVNCVRDGERETRKALEIDSYSILTANLHMVTNTY
ncbi:hypothetical protein V2J09_022365 [Rumex salicifolius]